LDTFKSFEDVLYKVNDKNFEDIALKLFRFQAIENAVYKAFLTHLGCDPIKIIRLEQIPFLPISFFKSHTVKTGGWISERVFTSSGTTGMATSSHEVPRLSLYLANCEKTFNYFFGPINDYHILALLPSYLEREGSSLVAMADYFISRSQSAYSGFYLNNQSELVNQLLQLKKEGSKKILLLGVSFAVLELAENQTLDLSGCIIMETGGMKGRRKELVREELHQILCERLNVKSVFSEYGMTELMSQAYSLGDGHYHCPPWLKIILRDINDPFATEKQGKAGGINIIDLANFHTCAFIETHDLGRKAQNGSFEVLGRMDNSDVRGCNLLI
jgi:Acyl-protein synthetase, LuxE